MVQSPFSHPLIDHRSAPQRRPQLAAVLAVSHNRQVVAVAILALNPVAKDDQELSIVCPPSTPTSRPDTQ
jgi:hypothetical protein